MRVIKSDLGFLAYQKILKKIQSNSFEIILWQICITSGKRNVIKSHLNSFYSDLGSIDFKITPDTKLKLEQPIYCYCKDIPLIFKSDIQSSKGTVVRVSMPLEIKMLEENEVAEIAEQMSRSTASHWITRSSGFTEKIQTYSVTKKAMNERSKRDQEFLNNEFDEVSMDEEEKMFAGKRESPRSRPKIDKWVKVRVDGFDDIKFLKLFDLSRGGMSFLVIDPENFPKGNGIQVLGFEEFDLDDPLIGKIMSHRNVDASQVEFKIGIKFAEGQD